MNNGLLDALKEIGWPDIPKAIGANYKKRWIKAIVKVRKYNGLESYCIAVNDGDGKPRIIRDFGPTSIIADVISIHPYVEARGIGGGLQLSDFSSGEELALFLAKRGVPLKEANAAVAEGNRERLQKLLDGAIAQDYIFREAENEKAKEAIKTRKKTKATNGRRKTTKKES